MSSFIIRAYIYLVNVPHVDTADTEMRWRVDLRGSTRGNGYTSPSLILCPRHIYIQLQIAPARHKHIVRTGTVGTSMLVYNENILISREIISSSISTTDVPGSLEKGNRDTGTNFRRVPFSLIRYITGHASRRCFLQYVSYMAK